MASDDGNEAIRNELEASLSEQSLIQQPISAPKPTEAAGSDDAASAAPLSSRFSAYVAEQVEFWKDVRATIQAEFHLNPTAVAQTTTETSAESSSAPPAVKREALNTKILRRNVARLTDVVKVLKHTRQVMLDVIAWRRPREAALVTGSYIFSALYGCMLSMLLCLLLVVLVMLSFQRDEHKEEAEAQAQKQSLASKIKGHAQLVGEVAETAQNVTGEISDFFERLFNLCTWQDSDKTMRVVMVLGVALVASTLLPSSILSALVKAAIFWKLFVIRGIYTRYPELKARHKKKSWFKSIQTNVDIMQDELEEEQAAFKPSEAKAKKDAASLLNKLPFRSDRRLDKGQMQTLTKIGVPPSESLEGTWNCAYLENNSIVHSRRGLLVMTKHHLAFLRSSEPQKSFQHPLSTLLAAHRGKASLLNKGMVDIFFLPETSSGPGVEVKCSFIGITNISDLVDRIKQLAQASVKAQ